MNSSASFFYRMTDGIRVSVRPTYLPEQSIPEQQQFVFAYFVRIENVGALTRHDRLPPPGIGCLRDRWI